MTEVEILNKIKAVSTDKMVLFRSAYHFYVMGEDIHSLREIMRDRVFTRTSVNGQLVYSFNVVNLAEVIRALAQNQTTFTIIDRDVDNATIIECLPFNPIEII